MAPPAGPRPQASSSPPPPPTRRPRGRPRVRTEQELQQRRRAWYRQRYRRSADLGRQSERWRRLRQRLGHGRDEETAAALLDRYFERSRHNCSGQDRDPDPHGDAPLPPSLESLRLLVLWAHTHGRDCPLAPAPRLPPPGSTRPVAWACPNGHHCPWEVATVSPLQRGRPARGRRNRDGGQHLLQMVCESDEEGERLEAEAPGPLGEEQRVAETELLLTSDDCREDPEVDSDVFEFLDDPKDRNYVPSSDSGSDRDKTSRCQRNPGRKTQEQPVERRPSRKRPEKHQVSERPRKIRKKIPKQYVRCEFEGCGKIVSNPQYLKRHMKYQHHLQRTFSCSQPSCGRIFRFKTQMEEHVKLHSDQRDYICEFCGRAFKTDKNLVVHRRIHTGEKPLQCEICGFTCRQKASLNWHMKKHDAEAGYQFPCDVCGKRFEKKDNVSAHKSKSHPETGLGAVGVGSFPCPEPLGSGLRGWVELQAAESAQLGET